MLIPAISLALPLVLALSGSLPAGNLRDTLLLGGGGTLHALAVVMSLRQRGSPARSVFFIVLATTGCVVVPLAAAYASASISRGLMPDATGDLMVLLALFFGSACAASVYWVLVRFFLAKELPAWSLMAAATVCGVATLLSFQLAGAAFPQAAPGSTSEYFRATIPTVGWWLAFSFTLYIGEG
jgi:hypothetical protein